MNGSRAKLSAEQLAFVGFEPDTGPTEASDPQWIPATKHSHIDKKLEELSRLMDIAPGYLALLKRILEKKETNRDRLFPVAHQDCNGPRCRERKFV